MSNIAVGPHQTAVELHRKQLAQYPESRREKERETSPEYLMCTKAMLCILLTNEHQSNKRLM